MISKDFWKIQGRRSLYFYSLVIGIGSGLGAVAFSHLLGVCEYFFLENLAGLPLSHPRGEYRFSGIQGDYNPYVFFFLPIIGGLASGLVIHFFSKDAAGTGTDAMVHAFHYKEGKIDPKVSLVKSIATILTLSSGGSGGKEGPISQIGAGFGVLVANLIKAGARARRTLLLAGTAGGLGSIFHAPLGGALTAVEMVYREDIESDSLIPCIISSVAAFLTYSSINGFNYVYAAGIISFTDYYLIPFFFALGLLSYITGFLFIRIFTYMQFVFLHLKLPAVIKPAVGGIFIGALGLYFPEVIGTGAGFIQDIFDGKEIVSSGDYSGMLIIFLILALLKIISTSITIGSGGSAGVFGPSLFIGGMLGGIVGSFAKIMFPADPLNITSFMLVGMGAFYSGVASAPIAGMLMVCEMTGSYVLLPPLMLVTIVNFFISNKLSIYKNQVENKFHSPAHYWDMNLDLMQEMNLGAEFPILDNDAVVNKTMRYVDLEDLSIKYRTTEFIVRDEENNYHGIVSLKHNKITRGLKEFVMNLILVEEVLEEIPALSSENSLDDAIKLMLEYDTDKIAILELNGKIKGFIRISDIIRKYKESIDAKPKRKIER